LKEVFLLKNSRLKGLLLNTIGVKIYAGSKSITRQDFWNTFSGIFL